MRFEIFLQQQCMFRALPCTMLHRDQAVLLCCVGLLLANLTVICCRCGSRPYTGALGRSFTIIIVPNRRSEAQQQPVARAAAATESQPCYAASVARTRLEQAHEGMQRAWWRSGNSSSWLAAFTASCVGEATACSSSSRGDVGGGTPSAATVLLLQQQQQ